MKRENDKSISRLPASHFPDAAEGYFCDNCGRDLTKHLYQDRSPVWQPLRPIWYVCPCGKKYHSGAAEWDDLTIWERRQRLGQLWIGFVLFAILVIPVTLAYFALSYGGAALLCVVGIALIPSVVAAKPFGFVLLDVYEIIASIWRTRIIGRRASPAITIKRWMRLFKPQRFRLTPVAVVIAVLIIATRWIPPHLDPGPMIGALSSPERASAGPQEALFAPTRLPHSGAAQAAVTGALSPAFKRIRVGPDEVDYIAEDVTIRHFTPRPSRPRAQLRDEGVQLAYKEVRIGADVTMRYFRSEPAVTPRTHAASVDRSLPLSK